MNLALRPRRLRLNDTIQRMVRETRLHADNFVLPFFVRPGTGIKYPIASMPGQFQWSIDLLVEEVKHISALGIPAIMLFGIPTYKDATGSDNFSTDGIIPQAIRALKQAVPALVVISDLCFCEYTSHGHCGLINTPDSPYYQPQLPQGYLLNDETLTLLGRAAVVHAQAGADIIAPSGMIDGMVGAIRQSLDAHQLTNTSIMSYAVKYASGFYGPFRDAAESPPQFGNRHTYQMDSANRREALREIALDIAEGADMLMVKPAMAYLDVIAQVRAHTTLPVVAYQVSGEYAMLHAAAQNGWIDLPTCAIESLIGIKRAGADIIISYFAKDVLTWLK